MPHYVHKIKTIMIVQNFNSNLKMFECYENILKYFNLIDLPIHFVI